MTGLHLYYKQIEFVMYLCILLQNTFFLFTVHFWSSCYVASIYLKSFIYSKRHFWIQYKKHWCLLKKISKTVFFVSWNYRNQYFGNFVPFFTDSFTWRILNRIMLLLKIWNQLTLNKKVAKINSFESLGYSQKASYENSKIYLYSWIVRPGHNWL